MKIALLQINYVVGDFPHNSEQILSKVKKAGQLGAELCITSEMALWGYPAKDLLLKKGYVKQAQIHLEKLSKQLKNSPAIILGTTVLNEETSGKKLYNGAVFIENGAIQDSFQKQLLPTYDVFDEHRYFKEGSGSQILNWKGLKIGITICEDILNNKEFENLESYTCDPILKLVSSNVDFIVNLSGSPYSLGKHQHRQKMLAGIASKYGFPIYYVNQVGGNDDLIFDGRSFALNKEGNLLGEAKAFENDLFVFDTKKKSQKVYSKISNEEEVWKALILGTRDYVKKSGFSDVILGLSGGIDSALTSAIATQALGSEHVLGVLMPSPYSSKGSLSDSYDLAKSLKIKTYELPIESAMEVFQNLLKIPFTNSSEDTTEENIQSRIRGVILMALSNKFKSLLLTTGNKSEIAVGYCTIYGDMSGALGVIADIPKSLVFQICYWINESLKVKIPQNIIDKPPSAELRPNQKDEDSLPPYSILDDILEKYIEKHETLEDIVLSGHDPEVVKKIVTLIKISEFKRKQAAPGLKITDRAFGSGWRMPLASRYPDLE